MVQPFTCTKQYTCQCFYRNENTKLEKEQSVHRQQTNVWSFEIYYFFISFVRLNWECAWTKVCCMFCSGKTNNACHFCPCLSEQNKAWNDSDVQLTEKKNYFYHFFFPSLKLVNIIFYYWIITPWQL